jgi:hypothetical protein
MTDAVVNILTGPYMSSLSQYRDIGSGFLQSSIVVSTAIGSSPASPPASFSNTDVSTLLSNMLAAGLMPGPATDAELLYSAAASLQRIAQLGQALAAEAAALSSQMSGQAGSGQAFIQPGERPPVGEQALREPYAPRRLY